MPDVRSRKLVTLPSSKTYGGEPPTLEFKEMVGRLLSKAVAGQEGIVEALVAVTGNTDDGGDVIQPGSIFFKRAPKVVWSHNLRELVGKVLVYEEWKPGDVRLPTDLKAKGLGALYFKIAFDLEDPESFKAYRKVVFHEDLGWSIGYEVDPKGFKMLPDGRRSLTKIYVWEGSPTTFGMNQEARTVSVKSLISKTVEDLGLPDDKTDAIKAALGDLVASLAPGSSEEKAWAPLSGSFEEITARLRTAVEEWADAVIGAPSDVLDWYVSVEGTFEDNVVATVRVWKGEAEGGTWRFPYTESSDGTITLGDPEAVEVVADVAPVSGTPTDSGEGTTMEAASISTDLSAKLATAQQVVTEMSEEVKAGRVLSAANAARLREAQQTITEVLAAAEGTDKTEKAVVTRTVETKAPVAGTPEAGKEFISSKDILGMLSEVS